MTARALTTLLEGGAFFEGPRWHDGRWWVSDFCREGVYTVRVDGNEELVLEVEQRGTGRSDRRGDPHPRGLGCFACALGGDDGCTLLLCAAPDFLEMNRRQARAAVLLTTTVEVPHAGRP